MEKKKYVKPILNSEEFIPQEYIAACENPVSYKGKCDTTGYIFIDTNKNGVYDPFVDNYKYKNTACENYFESTVKPEYNAFAFEDYYWDSKLGDGHLGEVRIGKGKCTPVYNFDNTHANHFLDTNIHYNVS